VLHGMNALVIFSLSGLLAHRTWMADRAGAELAAADRAAEQSVAAG
jgi:hypothetical protein